MIAGKLWDVACTLSKKGFGKINACRLQWDWDELVHIGMYILKVMGDGCAGEGELWLGVGQGESIDRVCPAEVHGDLIDPT